MGWAFRVGRVAGIDVYLHFTFLLLLAWVGVGTYLAGGDGPAAVAAVAFALALFGIVVLHELGHALAARRYGIPTHDITLLPIGGVARLDRMPDNPAEEMVVALAGPAVNVVLAAGLYVGDLAGRGLVPIEQAATWGGRLVDQLFWVNVTLAGFNLLPAFPMDGGRVLRAALALRTDYARATRAAANVGKGMAVGFGLAGLFGWLGAGPLMLFVAWFVWMGAEAEAKAAETRAALDGLTTAAAAIRQFVALTPADVLRTAAHHVLDGFQQDFPVLDDGQVVGVLPRSELLAGLARGGPDTPVGAVMRTEFQTADAGEPLPAAVARLAAGECPVLPVVRAGRLVGLLTAENVSELVLIREAMSGQVPPAGPRLAPAG